MHEVCFWYCPEVDNRLLLLVEPLVTKLLLGERSFKSGQLRQEQIAYTLAVIVSRQLEKLLFACPRSH